MTEHPRHGTTSTPRRNIEVDRGSGTTTFVERERTPRSFQQSDIQPGRPSAARIDVRPVTSATAAPGAEHPVIRSISSNGSIGGSTTQTATIRGTGAASTPSTARSSSNRRIGFQLHHRHFTTSRTVIHYDTNAGINVNGRTNR
jgi:hypothetical protein